jgi:hypothetical protein
VLLEPCAKVFGEADVVEFVALVECVDAVAAADIFADEVLVFFERDAVDVFELLADELGAAGHGILLD